VIRDADRPPVSSDLASPSRLLRSPASVTARARAGRVVRSRGALLAELALAGAVVAGTTLALFPISELDPGASSGVLYVLGVLLLATYRGLWLGLVASVASAIALDYFHADPSGRLDEKNPGDFVAIGVLLTTATVASVIADRARQRAEEAKHRVQPEDELRTPEAERIRLDEVHSSRARVIEAADQERRRVLRDLHDGAQQRLVHTIITLKLARGVLERGETGASPLVDEALVNAQRATDELRDLAHGIVPSVLTHGGLRAGVHALASRMPMPVEMDVPSTRLAANVETTAYFIIAEALTNVAKHARASRASVTATVADEWLDVQVHDDGVGGARPGGSGLLGMHDRLAALGGRLQVESPPGGGTLIAAKISVRRKSSVSQAWASTTDPASPSSRAMPSRTRSCSRA
jgi:signal transduction histidine kinase